MKKVLVVLLILAVALPAFAEEKKSFKEAATDAGRATINYPANLVNESVFDIAERLEKNELALALMDKGPLGLAEALGKQEAAVELLKSKGSCGVCHALKENLI